MSKDLIAEARELCAVETTADLDMLRLIECTGELCDALEKANAEVDRLSQLAMMREGEIGDRDREIEKTRITIQDERKDRAEEFGRMRSIYIQKADKLIARAEKAEAEADFWKSKFKTLQQCDIHNLTDCDFCQNLICANAEIERLREAQMWIPITEQYPPDKSTVLACVKYSWNDSEHLMMLSFAKNGNEIDDCDLAGQTNVFYEYDSEYGYCPYDNITNWMPLPSPPGKGE